MSQKTDRPNHPETVRGLLNEVALLAQQSAHAVRVADLDQAKAQILAAEEKMRTARHAFERFEQDFMRWCLTYGKPVPPLPPMAAEPEPSNR